VQSFVAKVVQCHWQS